MEAKSNNWLKLKVDFFSSLAIKKIRKIAGGETYIIIYQKMMLLTVNSEGHYAHQGLESSIEEELALILDENIENIKIVMQILQSSRLIEIMDGAIYLNQVPQLIGKVDNSAERVARYRANQKLLINQNSNLLKCNALHSVTVTNGNSDVTVCNAPRDREEIDKIKIRENKEKNKTNATKVACVSDFDLSMFSEEEIEAINTWIEFRSKTYNLKKTNQAIKVVINNLVTAKENGRNIPVMIDYFINNTTMQNINATNIEVAIKQIKAANKND